MLMTKNNIYFWGEGRLKFKNLSAGIVDQILVALKEDNAVEIPKRDRITIYVSDIAKGMERIKEKCYSDKMVQKISKDAN